MRFFNTAGPVQSSTHYCLDPLVRVDKDTIVSLIDQKKYFVIHAPRQTGKTSSLLALTEYLNCSGRYGALYINVETAQAAREDVDKAIEAILYQMEQRSLLYLNDSFIQNHRRQILQDAGALSALNAILSLWAQSYTKPLVVLIDEIDSLIGDSLISVLRQLRAGYDMRPTAFPQSVILCGVRDVRDYRIYSHQSKKSISGGSCFNIKSESLRLGDFTIQDLKALYAQHTEETGQVFEEDALQQAWFYTQGQPWLVNALADQICFRDPIGKNRAQPISASMVDSAKEDLVLRRETHIDQLTDRLKEPRIQRVMEPFLQGETFGKEVQEDDLQYLVDLGMLRRGAMGPEVANPIYKEVIPRVLTQLAQENMGSSIRPGWYQKADGSIDGGRLLESFQQFFRENSESWIERFDYKEAGPQLLLQAFLQRIVNGGGQVHREYGLGRGRTDLLIQWKLPDASIQKIVIECMIARQSISETISNGLEQTSRYMDQCGANEGHLVIFDRSSKSWDVKVFHQTHPFKGLIIQVWGM